MIGEEDYYGAISAESPFFLDGHKKMQDEKQNVWCSESQIPSSWSVVHSIPWTYISPVKRRLRIAGWKIHLSATMENAEKILLSAIQSCVSREVIFKYLRSPEQLFQTNSKYANRSGSGKFVTIYPSSDDEFDQIVDELEGVIGTEKSPYVLSDIRYGESPIYFRYGGFIPIKVNNEIGVNREYVPGADGLLVEDLRVPHFINPPSQIHRPRSVDQAYQIYMEDSPSPLDDYEGIESIYFSNGGGVYLARKKNGESTLLKEARPYAGLDQRHQAAPARLDIEWSMLNMLGSSNVAPKPMRKFTAWEHLYIEMEYLHGASINNWVAQHYPFLGIDPLSRKTYAKSVIILGKKIVACIKTVHSFGYVHGDIHPSNIMVINDGRDIRFIDFESARPLNSKETTTGNALGYLAPAHFTPEEADWFGVSRVLASLFYPTSAIAMLSPDYWPKMLDQLENEFGREARELVTSVDDLYPSKDSITPVFFTPRDAPNTVDDCFPSNGPVTKAELQQFRDRLIDGVQAAKHRTPGLLYPPDVSRGNRFAYANIKTGAAGVLFSLLRAGAEIPETDMTWLMDAVYRDIRSDNVDFGLFTGISGVAMLNAEMHRNEEAEFLLEKALGYGEATSDLSLESGLSGLALAALAYGNTQEDNTYERRGQAICSQINKRLFDMTDPLAIRNLNSAQGFLRGWSGVALLNIAAAQVGGKANSENINIARQCIKNDLQGNPIDEFGIRGTLDRYNRSLPYLEKGSAGILIAVCALRTATKDDSLFVDEWESLVKACSSSLYAFSGLYHGRAGIIAALNMAIPWTHDSKTILDRHWKSYNQYGLSWHGNLYLPGESYLRLSCDYSTGSAGVISVVNDVIDQRWSFLPVVCAHNLFSGNTTENNNYERR